MFMRRCGLLFTQSRPRLLFMTGSEQTSEVCQVKFRLQKTPGLKTGFAAPPGTTAPPPPSPPAFCAGGG